MNSAPLRNPLATLQFEVGENVDMKVQGGKIIIQAVKSNDRLDHLRAEHTALNLPKDSAWLNFEDLQSERIV